MINSAAAMYNYQPPVNREMKSLDRSFFTTKIPLCVVTFPDPKNISLFTKEFKDSILRVPRIPHVVKLNQTGNDLQPNGKTLGKTLACDNGIISKGVLLHHTITNVDEAKVKLKTEALAFLHESNAEILPFEFILDYKFWKAEEILKAVLPEEYLNEIPTGFTVTGHIAHLNLRQEFKPYASFIGQVILDKNNKIETVVDKVSSIATKFRTFPMQVIAGRDDDLIVEQKESNCTFRFDFSKVYWNSRLHTEHERLVTQYFRPGQVVCDVFAGVGPFAIPAGKKDVIVLANDLNPESFKYLKENIALNKVDQLVKPFNLDGGEFIVQSPKLLKNWIANETDGKISVQLKSKNNRKRHKKQDDVLLRETAKLKEIPIPFEIHHFVMNLPDSAITFLDRFIGLYDGTQVQQLPWIHVHCFEKYGNEEEPSVEELYERVYNRILKSLHSNGESLRFEDLSFHLVRKVSPTKPMFCVSFQLPRDIAYTK